MLHHTWSADTHTDNLLCFTDPMEGACHKRIIPRGITENDELGTAQRIIIAGKFCRALDDLAHFPDAVHIDTSLGGTKIYRRTDDIRRCQCLRNRVNQNAVTVGKALFHQSRKTTDEVDTDFLGGPVHGFCHRHIGIRLAGIRCNGNRRNGHALMDDGDTVFRFNILTRLYEELRRLGNLVIHIAAKLVHIRMRTIPQGNAHGNGTHVQFVLGNHLICFNDIVYANQKLILLKVTSDVVHYIEDIGMLRLDIHVDFLTAFLELLLQIHQLNLAAADFCNQNHIKVAIQDVLIDRQNVDIVLGENLANHGDNAYTVFAYNGYYKFHLHISPSIPNSPAHCVNIEQCVNTNKLIKLHFQLYQCLHQKPIAHKKNFNACSCQFNHA